VSILLFGLNYKVNVLDTENDAKVTWSSVSINTKSFPVALPQPAYST